MSRRTLRTAGWAAALITFGSATTSLRGDCAALPEQVARLTPVDAYATRAGHDVAADGDTVVVSALGYRANGIAYVYRNDGDAWQPVGGLSADDVPEFYGFGSSVGISGNTVIVGTTLVALEQPLAVSPAYVYRETAGQWQQIGRLTTIDAVPTDGFGSFVAISGNTALVSATRQQAGAVFVFREIDGAWQEIAKLTAADGVAGESFGASLAIDGATALVGAYKHVLGNYQSGAAYVFREIGGVWQQTAKLTAGDAPGTVWFGYSVALSGSTAVVGAWLDNSADYQGGAAYVFREIAGDWQRVATLLPDPPAREAHFGNRVALSGDVAAVGSFSSQIVAPYLFREIGGAWQRVTPITRSDGSVDGGFGRALAVGNATLVVGAAGEFGPAGNSGAAYIFDLAAHDCDQNAVADTCDIAAGSAEDCNGDGFIDECNPPGDANGNGRIGRDDQAALAECLSGVDSPAVASCCLSDADRDGDVDLADFAILQNGVAGS